MNNEVSAPECRDLREFIDALAMPGIINRQEYHQIMLALKSCVDRMEAEGRVIDA